MILSLPLTRLGVEMSCARVHRICVQPGAAVQPGTALFEMLVELGARGAQDCPPRFHFRLVATERAIVRAVYVQADQSIEVGSPLALLSTLSDEPLDAAPARALRCTSISIQVDSFSG